MRKVLISNLVVVLFFVLSTTVQAQSDADINKRSSFRDRTFVGGGLGAGFGTVTWVQLAPIVGYRITNELSAGVGVQYRYNSYKNFNPKISTNDYGASLFTRYNIYQQYFAQTEFEYLNYNLINTRDLSKSRKGYNALLIGGGMSQPLGGKVYFNLIALYNVLYKGSSTSPYGSPWVIRAGISLGL